MVPMKCTEDAAAARTGIEAGTGAGHTGPFAQ
jgi:hypothetical protein